MQNENVSKGRKCTKPGLPKDPAKRCLDRTKTNQNENFSKMEKICKTRISQKGENAQNQDYPKIPPTEKKVRKTNEKKEENAARKIFERAGN